MGEKVEIALKDYTDLIRSDQKLLSALVYIYSYEYPNVGVIKSILEGKTECTTEE